MSYGSVVDPSFELLDPCPDIHALFTQFDARFFDGSLACCEVKWSPRMYSCAGICSYEVRGRLGGLCSIRLSKPLLKLRPRKDLVETLLHEMIHAYLFVKERNKDRDGHGPRFQEHMHRINRAGGTNITIYHSFHDEVRLYKQHWWRCTGPCKDRRPFFGYVKRTCNRPPGPNDRWWSQHRLNCQGDFIKVKEPDGFGKKKTKKPDSATIIRSNGTTSKKNVARPKMTLDDFFQKNGGVSKKSPIKSVSSSTVIPFTGASQKLGGSSSTSTLFNTSSAGGVRLGGTCATSRLLQPVHASSRSPSSPEIICIDDSEDNQVPNDENDELEISFVLSATTVICPSCNTEVVENMIHGHLDYCLA